jgi:hypothetical protein
MISPLKLRKIDFDWQVAQRGSLPDNYLFFHLTAISTIKMVPINKIINPIIRSVRLIVTPD